jgi:hypothetical protein
MPIRCLLVFILMNGYLLSASAQSGLGDKYAWYFPVPDTIRQADDLLQILQEEVDKILGSGPLAPIRLAFGDLYWEHYFQYQEPGRILTTLAWAWPYLSADQQSRTLDYVLQELSMPGRAPWSSHYTLPRDQGSRRERYPSTDLYGVDVNFGDFRPRLHVVYGFWLFCYRSGQHQWMETYYPSIKSFYQSQQQRARLYGDMNGHMAMARMARINGDEAMEQFALARFEEELFDGLQVEHKHDFAANGFSGWDAPYNRLPGSDMYDSRKDGWLYRGFIFLNMGPEVARFLKDSCFQQVDSMHQAGRRILPMWWLMQAPYYPRWTGDESIGVPTEAFGMYHPVETWVLESPVSQLRKYMRSSPTGIGDCYWIEALVQTIEAHAGHTNWIDVRETPFPGVVVETGTTSTLSVFAEVSSFMVYPNPASEVVYILPSATMGPVTWSVRNMHSHLLMEGRSLPGESIQVHIAGWPSGNYVITLFDAASHRFTSQILIKP